MDASQEVFLRAYRFLRRYDSRRPFEPWLMRMTVNVRRDLGRKKTRNSGETVDPEILPSRSDLPTSSVRQHMAIRHSSS